jgi:hypothetical protein
LIRNIHRQQARLKSLDAMRDDAKEQNRAPMDEESYEFAGEQQLCVGQVLDFLDKEPPPRKGAKRTIDLLRFTVEFGSDTEALAAFLGTSQGAAKERKRYALQKIRELCLRFCGAENCAIGTAS